MSDQEELQALRELVQRQAKEIEILEEFRRATMEAVGTLAPPPDVNEGHV